MIAPDQRIEIVPRGGGVDVGGWNGCSRHGGYRVGQHDATFGLTWMVVGGRVAKEWTRWYCIAHVPAKWIRFFESMGVWGRFPRP